MKETRIPPPPISLSVVSRHTSLHSLPSAHL